VDVSALGGPHDIAVGHPAAPDEGAGGHTDVDRSNAADPPTLGTSILPVASSGRVSMGYTTPPVRPANVLVMSRNVVQSSGRYRITNQSCVLGVTRLGHPQGDNRRAWTRGCWSVSSG
jgi:hypothetical protein